MLVMHHAGGLIEHLPAALPGQKTQVGVFQIERRQQFVEAAQLEKLPPVERARAATAVKAWKQAIDRRVLAMAHAQTAVLPPALGQSRFLALRLVLSPRKIWQDTAKTVSSVNPASSGARKSGSTRMSLFNRTTTSFVAARNPAFEPPPKPRVSGQREDPNLGVIRRASIPRCRRSIRCPPR